MREEYSTNQNLETNQLEPSHKKSTPLKDSYINRDILSTLAFYLPFQSIVTVVLPLLSLHHEFHKIG